MNINTLVDSDKMIANTKQTWNLFWEENVESEKRPRSVGHREEA